MFTVLTIRCYGRSTSSGGEFIGKYLTHCTQLFRSTASTELKPALGAQIALCFRTLIKYQSAEGYIGPWPSGKEWNTTAWDA